MGASRRGPAHIDDRRADRRWLGHDMSLPELTPRAAEPADFAPLAELWALRWRDAHESFSPPELTALRTPADFLRRLRAFGDGLRVIGPVGAPLGFVVVLDHHVDQLFIARGLQGQGAADLLMADALARIAAAGHAEAQLECAPGNARAAAYYRKSGWALRGTETVSVDTSTGPFPIDLMIFTRPTEAP
ncbi:GNAT family N-acetyltransferase [Thioclava sp. BHET1]|nr:GNAT family N-acetyltransferase [Thioclava sp. BHET1]